MTGAGNWMLGGDPPEAQKWEDAKPNKDKDVEPSETHTGTDPNGRAVGPNEDHTKVKKVLNEKGEVVNPPSVRRRRGKN